MPIWLKKSVFHKLYLATKKGCKYHFCQILNYFRQLFFACKYISGGILKFEETLKECTAFCTVFSKKYANIYIFFWKANKKNHKLQ